MTEPGRPQSPQQNTRAGEFQQAWQGEFQQPQYWQEPQQNPWQEPPMNQMGERNAVESARRSYSRIGASFSVMIVVWMALVFVLGIGISMLHWMWVSLLVSDCSFYLVAVPLAYLMLRSVPEEPTRKFGMTFGELFEWFLVSLAIVFVGGLLGNALAALFSGGMAQNRLDNIVGGIPAWLNILAVVVVGPIVEEWLCRKQIIARVRRYGERLAIVVSALVFALFHLNLYQFFYAFGLGSCSGTSTCAQASSNTRSDCTWRSISWAAWSVRSSVTGATPIPPRSMPAMCPDRNSSWAWPPCCTFCCIWWPWSRAWCCSL